MHVHLACIVHCEISNKPNNGIVMDYESYNSSLQEGSVINFKCDYGFFLTGEAISICSNSEQWSAIPTCNEGKIITCMHAW